MNISDKIAGVKNSNHAVVIGGSIAGLLAARVLTNHFERVSVIESDCILENLEPRPGVPQSRHVHILLTRGQQILEEFFPGIIEELATHQAIEINWTSDMAWLVKDGWQARSESEINTRTCTRNLLENILRNRLKNLTRIQFFERCKATNLIPSRDRKAVVGAIVQTKNKKEIELPAHLIVDASGRNSQAPKWLEALGYQKPPETEVKSYLGYASRWYRCPPSWKADWKILYIQPAPPDRSRGGIIFPVENTEKYWLVSLMGVGKDYPPHHEEGFLEFAKTLRDPTIYQAIKNAEPLSPIYSYHPRGNRFRHYEKLDNPPENFVSLGDAVCVFNPVYGQGMTVAALGALTLNRCLQQQKEQPASKISIDFSRNFHKQLARVIDRPWQMTIGEDLRWPTTEGHSPNLIQQLNQKYMDLVFKAIVDHPEVARTFTEVVHMLKQPTVLYKPSIFVKVIEYAFK